MLHLVVVDIVVVDMDSVHKLHSDLDFHMHNSLVVVVVQHFVDTYFDRLTVVVHMVALMVVVVDILREQLDEMMLVA